MALVKLYDMKKHEVGELELDDTVFKTKLKPTLVHQAIVTQLAGRRRGTASTKTKAEVRGGGKKPFKQKGTGNARQGSSRSPLMPGGGENFGPKPRSYFKTFPKKMAQSALRSVLSDKLSSDRLLVIKDIKLTKPSAKQMAEVLKHFGMKKALIVDSANEAVELSTRNLPTHKFLRLEGVNVYDVVNHEWLILSKDAAVALSEKLALAKKRASKEKSHE